jgi:predicted DNA-binding transcriptional regulator AlpA
LNHKQAAAFLGMHPETLKKYVAAGEIPSPHRLSKRMIRYSRVALERWAEGNKAG